MRTRQTIHHAGSRRHRCVLRTAALSLALAAPWAPAQTVDSSFAPQPSDQIHLVADHVDGGIVVGGFFRDIDGIGHGGFTRLGGDGHVSAGFHSPEFHDSAWSASLMADGRIVIGGDIRQVDGINRRGVVRLAADGLLDATFQDPNVTGRVYATALQADGKILIAGDFTSVGGQPHANLARLLADGSLDAAFDPQVNDWVRTMVLQPDGGILIGGDFTAVGSHARKYLARVHSDAGGSLDATFNPPAPNNRVLAIARQPDDRVVIGGDFNYIGSIARSHLARLDANGNLDAAFADPGLQSWTDSIVLQTDGKLLVAGAFTAIGGTPRASLARINANGSLDTGFADLGADDYIDALTLQADGHLIVGGRYLQIGAQAIGKLARVTLPDAAQQSFTVDGGGSRATWKRAGSSPELSAPPLLYRSADNGASWTPLGAMQRIAGGWQKTGIPMLLDRDYRLRVDGLVPGGVGGNSQGRARAEGEFFFSDELFADDFDDHSSR